MNRRQFLTGVAGASALALLADRVSAQSGQVHQIRIVDFEYHPVKLTIRAGDTVTWRNEDFVPHTATAMDHGWDTGNLEKGETGSVRFNKPGKYAYYCAHHPTMIASLIVT